MLLLAREADVDATDNYGASPLHYSARAGHVTVTRLLVSAGADVGARTRFGARPSDWARRHQRNEWAEVEALLEAA